MFVIVLLIAGRRAQRSLPSEQPSGLPSRLPSEPPSGLHSGRPNELPSGLHSGTSHAGNGLSKLRNRPLVKHGVILGVWLFGAYAFQTIGLLHTTTTNTGFITGLSVVLVPFITVWLSRQRLPLMTWAAATFALIGLYLLTFNGGAMDWNRGDLFVLLCAFCFAFHIALTGKYAPLYDTVALVTVQLATVGVLAALSSLLFEPLMTLTELWQALSHPPVWIALTVSIGLSTAFAFWAQTWCQRYTSASRVAVIYATEPVFAAITGVTFAGELLGTWAIAGCVLIFAAMILAELKWGKHEVQ
ncbi:DMT family transporter [Paenibacillus sp. 481]|nr:DMT family transporter [Paenibacillus sp. 481]